LWLFVPQSSHHFGPLEALLGMVHLLF